MTVTLDSVLWLAGDAATAALIALLFFRGVWRRFPVFIAYVAQSLIGDLALSIVLHGHRSAYTACYFAETILDSILLFGVLVELTWSILRPLRGSLTRGALIPVSGLVLAVGIAIWPFTALPGLAGAGAEKHLIVQLQQTVSILQVVFFLALIACSQLLSIGWRDRELQIATGLGFWSVASLAVAMIHVHQSSYLQYTHLVRVEIGAYLCSLLYWIISFARQEAQRREFTPEMQRLLLAMAGTANANRVALARLGAVKSQKDDRQSR